MRITSIISALLLTFALAGCSTMEVAQDYPGESKNISVSTDMMRQFENIYEQHQPCRSDGQMTDKGC